MDEEALLEELDPLEEDLEELELMEDGLDDDLEGDFDETLSGQSGERIDAVAVTGPASKR
jgi:hypothetical protein